MTDEADRRRERLTLDRAPISIERANATVRETGVRVRETTRTRTRERHG